MIDAVENQRRVWEAWAARHGLDSAGVYSVALRTRPMDTFAIVAPTQNPHECLDLLHELENEDVRSGAYAPFGGAAELLHGLPPGSWALVTSNYHHRVRSRFARTGLPVPDLIVDAAAADRGKPSPDPYLFAADRLGARPEDCLVIEDTPSGVQAGVSAGMTVWSVNSPVPVAGAHRHFATLRDASADILSWTAPSGR